MLHKHRKIQRVVCMHRENCLFYYNKRAREFVYLKIYIFLYIYKSYVQIKKKYYSEQIII